MIEQFRNQGFLVVRGFFGSGLVGALRNEIDESLLVHPVLSPKNLRCRYHPHRANGELVLESIDPIVDICPSAKALALHSELSELLKVLLGDSPCLYKDKLVLKPSGANGYALHQDYIHWSGFPTTFTTVVVGMDATTEESGWIEVFPGMHRRGALSSLDGEYHDLSEHAMQGVSAVSLDLQPGDVAIFGCFLPHRSRPNFSPLSRRQLYLSYNAAFDGGDQRKGHYEQFHRWLLKRYGEYGAADLKFI